MERQDGGAGGAGPWVGRRVPRVEDARLLSGRGSYTDDLSLEGQLHAAFVRSPHAHARIAAIDIAAALAMPGVAAVLTGRDWLAEGLGGIDHAANPLDALDVKRRAFVAPEGGVVREAPHLPLAAERACHVGEPVAVVVADSAARARDAAEAVAVVWEPLPAVVSPVAALEPGAPRVEDAIPDNRCFSIGHGDAAATRAAFAAAACVVSHEFVNQRLVNAQMEPRSALGIWDAPRESLTLISGSQGVVRLQQVLAALFGLPLARVRVVSPDVGGGFGPRSMLYPEQAAVVWAARRLARPVKWTADRSEGFVSDYQARDSVLRAALALDRGGRILAYRAEMFGNVGAHTVTFVPLANARSILTTAYRVPVAHLLSHGVLTHTVPTAPYRGAGRPEAHHALERLLDMAAARLGIERAELRRRNLLRREELPWRNPMGVPLAACDFPGYQERALAAADWAGFDQRRDAARARGRLAGIGVANYVECPVGAPRERAEIAMIEDGTVDVIVGTQSTGQGHETSFAQVVADALDVPFDSIRVRYGDTDFVRAGGGTHSDRSMRLAGTLLVKAAGEVLERARAAAARRLEVAAADLEYGAGRFRVAGTDRSVDLMELARSGFADELRGAGDYTGRIPASPAGCAVCELEVDPDTGVVSITRYTTVDDVGQAVNPLIVDGQTHGGIVQGLGQALRESLALDPESGQVLAGSFMDYGLTRADETCDFDVSLVEVSARDAANPLGVKGGGEGGIVPATAAVINALCDALGVEDLAMPATPQAVWEALHRDKTS